MNSAILHGMLASRKQKKDEPVHEYYLTIRELAVRANDSMSMDIIIGSDIPNMPN